MYLFNLSRSYQRWLFLFFCLHLFACSRAFVANKKVKRHLVKDAKSYVGVPYKLGGTNYNGIDCSALTSNIFLNQHIKLPRQAWQQATFYKEIPLKKVKKGDLLFFVTSGKTINHVGIVSRVEFPQNIFFIHASTSKGVREDNLNNSYWKSKFVKASRSLKK